MDWKICIADNKLFTKRKDNKHFLKCFIYCSGLQVAEGTRILTFIYADFFVETGSFPISIQTYK